MNMDNCITMDSFGSECPYNWEEIADFLNNLIDERGIADDREATDQLWEDYCSGDIPGAPEAKDKPEMKRVRVYMWKQWSVGTRSLDDYEGEPTLDLEKAKGEAESVWDRLSAENKKQYRVFVAGYDVEIPVDDRRTLSEIYRDMVLDDEWPDDPDFETDDERTINRQEGDCDE